MAHQHWRIYVTAVPGAGAGAEVEIGELEFRATAGVASGPPTGGTASASSEYNATYTAAHAFDGTTSFGWGAAAGLNIGQWLRYSFATPVSVAEVAIKIRNFAWQYAPGGFDVQWSDNGTDWTTAASFTGLVASTWTTASSANWYAFTLPAETEPVTGTGSATLGDLTGEASGTAELAPITGTGTAALEALTSGAAGTALAPAPDPVTGTGSATLDDLTSEAAGTAGLPTITGTGSAELSPLTSSGTGARSFAPTKHRIGLHATWVHQPT